MFTPTDGGQGPTLDGEAKIGEFSWHELMTTAYEKAFAFYQTMFGWEKITLASERPIARQRAQRSHPNPRPRSPKYG